MRGRGSKSWHTVCKGYRQTLALGNGCLCLLPGRFLGLWPSYGSGEVTGTVWLRRGAQQSSCGDLFMHPSNTGCLSTLTQRWSCETRVWPWFGWQPCVFLDTFQPRSTFFFHWPSSVWSWDLLKEMNFWQVSDIGLLWFKMHVQPHWRNVEMSAEQPRAPRMHCATCCR